MFESPPEVMLPNDAFRALGFEGANPDCQRWLGKTEWVDLCPPYTHPHLLNRVSLFYVSHIGVNVYMYPIISYCLLSPSTPPTRCGRRESYR